MKGLRNEQALLAILLLLLTSLSTVSGSMPTIQSIETYFQETKPNKGTPLKLSESFIKEKFAGYGIGGTESSQTSLNAAYGVDKEDIKELAGFRNKKERFANHNGKKHEHFGNCGNHREEPFANRNGKKHEHFAAHGKKQVIEPFQGNLFATV